MFKPQRKTFRQTLIDATVVPILMTAAYASGLFFVSLSPPSVTLSAPPPQQQVERQAVKGTPQWFVEKFDCWTGEPPADMKGKLPGHVIVTIGPKTIRGDETLTGEALDMLFKGADSEIKEIHAFCR